MIDLIKECVRAYFGIADFNSTSKAPIHVWPRFVCMYLVNKHGASLREAAWCVGRVDHGACLHAKRRVEESMTIYSESRKTVNDIEQMIKERNHEPKSAGKSS